MCHAVLGVYAGGQLAFDPRAACLDGIEDGQYGTLTLIQHFGSDLHRNVRVHTLVLYGVFSEASPGGLTCPPYLPPRDVDVAWIVVTVRARVGSLLAARRSRATISAPTPGLPPMVRVRYEPRCCDLLCPPRTAWPSPQLFVPCLGRRYSVSHSHQQGGDRPCCVTRHMVCSRCDGIGAHPPTPSHVADTGYGD